VIRKVTKTPYAGKSGAARDFIKQVHDLTRTGHSHSKVLEDFLEMAFCGLAKQTHLESSDRAAELEERYMRVVRQRKPEYINAMPRLFGTSWIGVQEVGDFLGVISGELGALSEHMGQFFTPYELSRLMCELHLDADHIKGVVDTQGFVTVSEPSCGAGGMVLAAAERMRELGYDPRRHMYAEVIDLSATAYQMAYIQLSLAGIPARVFHGDTLRWKFYGCENTPAMLPFLLHNGARWAAWRRGEPVVVPADVDQPETAAEVGTAPVLPAPSADVPLGQMGFSFSEVG
jgi:hypothetical protein